MAKLDHHIFQAKHNVDFLKSFYGSYEFNDWAVTVSFYIAVHIVEAAIAKKKVMQVGDQQISIEDSEQLSGHKDLIPEGNLSYHSYRNIIISANFPEIDDPFKMLYRASRTARYGQHSFTKLKVELLVKRCLQDIINWSNKNHGADFELNLT